MKTERKKKEKCVGIKYLKTKGSTVEPQSYGSHSYGLFS